MKVAIFNVKYSPNLGDGVIAECLEHALRARARWTVWSVDLAGRERWSMASGGRSRAVKLDLLRQMPGWLGDTGVGLVLGFKIRTRLMKQWRQLLREADAAVFGGGQLIQDVDLNFPIKLAGAAGVCRSMNIPVAIFAVGATPCRSALGRRLFRKLLASPRLVHAAARDEASCAVLRGLGCDAQVCCDPGLLACEVWPVPARAQRARPLVGLGITHPAVLSHHGGVRTGNALSLYRSMAERLAEAGMDVVCFTNGAAEDEVALSQLGSRLRERGSERENGNGDNRCGSVHVARRAETPADLARLVAQFDCVIAHRLHAAILAYSYKVPSVGLRWDEKLVRFYQSVGRADLVIPFDAENLRLVECTVRKAMMRPSDDVTHDHILAQTVAGIDRLIAAVDACADPVRESRAVKELREDFAADPVAWRARPAAGGASLADEGAQ